jgi:hypothetical protein
VVSAPAFVIAQLALVFLARRQVSQEKKAAETVSGPSGKK